MQHPNHIQTRRDQRGQLRRRRRAPQSPAWAIRKYCKTLYGLNCSPLNRNYKYKDSLLDITLRTYNLMSKANTLQDLNLCDYVVRTPGNAQFGTFDLSALKKAVAIGYEATCKVLETSMK